MPRPLAARLSPLLPWAGFAAWTAGAVGIYRYGSSPAQSWSPGELVLAALGWLAVAAVVGRTAVRNLFGPVFAYEMLRLGRRRSTLLFRFVYAFLLGGLLVWTYWSWQSSLQWRVGQSDVVPAGELAKFATNFFYVYAPLQLFVVAVLTPVYVAGSIADEKERKTLEFLLATDLRGYEIVFGKAVARVLTLLMYVLAGLPIIAFLQLLGGIDPDLLVAATAGTVVGVLGLAAVGVYFSVTLKRPRDAIALTYVSLIGYFAGSAVLGGYLKYLALFGARVPYGAADVFGYPVDLNEAARRASEAADWLAAGNPIYAIPSVMEQLFRGGNVAAAVTEGLAAFVLFWGVVFVALMTYSVARLRSIALRQTHGTPRKLKERAVRHRPVVGDDAMAWKEVFVDGGVRGGCFGSVALLLFAALVFGVPVVAFFAEFGDTLPVVGGLFWPGGTPYDARVREFRETVSVWLRVATGALGFLALMGVAVRGAGSVSGERDRDTWISLVATPLSAWEMVRAKWLGAVLGLRRLYALQIGVWAVGLACGAAEPVMVLVTALFYAVYVTVFGWIGVLCSMSARTTLVATVRAVLAGVFAVGGFWLVVGCCCAYPLSMLADGDRAVGELAEEGAVLLAGMTPPLVLGVMPVPGFGDNEFGPFSRRDSLVGPLAPAVGLFVWLAVGWLCGTASWRAYKRLSNRGETRRRSTPGERSTGEVRRRLGQDG